jgi:ferredoxin
MLEVPGGVSQKRTGQGDILAHRHMRIQDADACAGCLKCMRVCPSGALTAIAQRKENTMAASETKSGFNKRAFVSIAMLISATILPVSGVMNHELQFSALSMERHFWMAVHNSAATLFAILAILHITLNLKALTRYVRVAKGLAVSREGVAAFGVILMVVGGFASHVFHVR